MKYWANDAALRVDLRTRRLHTKGHFLYQAASSPTFACRREAIEEGKLPS